MTDRVKNLGDSDTIEGLYRAIRDGRPGALEGRCLIALRHWFQDLAAFDELTGQAMPEPLSALCERLTAWPSPSLDACCQDRLHRILEHVRHPLPELFKRLSERRLRDHAMLPIQAVRELDSRSLSALGRRPGRTIREKLADKPYLMAVRRRATVDTTENRLLKTLCLRLSELLAARAECFGICESQENKELFQAIEFWLRTPEADEIGRWENLPPNNVLLQHRSYRRLWNAWRWVQALDSDVQRDREMWHEQWAMTVFWAILARLDAQCRVRLPEQPCFLDYDRFRIRPARCPGEFVATVEGLFFPHVPPAHLTGFVTRKTDKGFGFARTAGLEKVFFHISEFVTRTDFDLASEGTVLRFALQETERGWEARDVYLAGSAKDFTLSLALNPGPEIRLAFQDGSNRVLASLGEPSGANLKAKVGAITTSVNMSPEGAARVANLAVSSMLPDEAPFAPASVVPRQSDHAVVDLAALRPRFADPAGTGTMPFRLLWQLWRLPEQDAKDIDLACCRAAALDPYATTVSVLDLLTAKQDQRLEPGTLSQAARAFAGRIADFLKTKSLTYLVPDAADDFSLETIRTNVNARFPGAQPLPRSIAAVFDWQSSDAFAGTPVRQGDGVVVLDTAGDDFCATPVVACHREDLARAVPASRGICWERCPTIQGDSELSSVSSAIRALQKSGCTFPHAVGRLCGLQGLLDEADGISWLSKDSVWFTSPPELADCCRAARTSAKDPWNGLARGLEPFLREMPPTASIFFLTIGDAHGDTVRLPPPALLGRRRAGWLPPCRQPARGGMILRQWQATAGGISLWRDHLPELSVRIVRGGQYAIFHLVKDVTVAPQRGVPVPIPIKEIFTLPAGQAYYEFPLRQGPEGHELRYQAYLNSSAFPLHAAVPCRLMMTFTYGEDEPYQLVFIPLDPQTAGFASVQARWKRRNAAAPTEAAFPRFPAPAAWEELQRWPKPGSDETKDLLTWISEELERLAREVDSLTKERHVGTVAAEWRTDRKGQLYTFAICDVGSVFCHYSAFLDQPETESIGIGSSVSFEVSESDSGLRAQWITLGDDIRLADANEILCRKLDDLTRWMRRGLRYPFLTVWAGGRSLDDTPVPTWFREVISRGRDILVRLLNMTITESASARCQDSAATVRDESLLLLCCLHRDAPQAVPERLLEVCQNMPHSSWLFARLYRHIGLALGDATLPWQNRLLQNILRISTDLELKHSSACLQALAVGLWRHPRLLEQFDVDDLETTLHRLADALEFDASKVSEVHDYFQEEATKDHLELLLGVLSTRSSMDSGIRSLLAPAQPLSERFGQVVECITDKICQYSVPLRSRIKLSVTKPPALYNTPDIIYALRLYLTGDSAARAIQVTGVSDDE